MSYILTLVSSTKSAPLTEKHFKNISKIIEHYNIKFIGKTSWLDKNKAAESVISNNAQSALIAHLRETLEKEHIDFFITSSEKRRKKLLLADMDSTITESETLDELAEHAGIKDQISEITTKAMEGQIDFHDALRMRVELLKGLNIEALTKTLEQTIISKGAETFVKTMSANGATCALVSGGFTFFTNAIAQQCGFNYNHGNALEIKDDKLTGQVTPPILDKFSKVEFLQSYINDNSLKAEESLAIGDGANDIPMLKTAGLGIGYHPKEAVKNDISNCILYGDLTTALYAQGYSSKDFVA